MKKKFGKPGMMRAGSGGGMGRLEKSAAAAMPASLPPVPPFPPSVTTMPPGMKKGGMARMEKVGMAPPDGNPFAKRKMAHGGMVHEDAAMDKKLIQREMKKKGLKSGGMVRGTGCAVRGKGFKGPMG